MQNKPLFFKEKRKFPPEIFQILVEFKHIGFPYWDTVHLDLFAVFPHLSNLPPGQRSGVKKLQNGVSHLCNEKTLLF